MNSELSFMSDLELAENRPGKLSIWQCEYMSRNIKYHEKCENYSSFTNEVEILGQELMADEARKAGRYRHMRRLE